MRVSKAKPVFVIAVLGGASLGCQVLGGVSSELTLIEGGGAVPDGLPPRMPLQWQAIDPGAGFVYVLPEWMHYAGFSDVRTSEVAPGKLRLGYAKHEARPRDVGKGWGLSLETTRTNLIPNSTWGGMGWAVGSAPAGPMTVFPDQNDPTGAMSALAYGSTGDQQSDKIAVPNGSIASAWLAGTSPSMNPLYAYFVYGSAYVPVTTSVGYARYDVTRASDDLGTEVSIATTSVGGAPAIAENTAIAAYAPQVETGLYPSSYIPTSGAPVLRNADNLSMDTGDFAPSGYFSVKIRYAPHYATGEQQYDHDVLAIEDDAIFVRMKVGGTLLLYAAAVPGDVRIEGLSWSRNQTLEIEAKYLASRLVLSVKGATTGDLVVTKEGEVPVMGVDPTTWILGDNDGPQESADLRYLEIR